MQGQKAFAMSVLHLPSSCEWICVSLENARLAFPISTLAELKGVFPEGPRWGALSQDG